MPRFSSLRSVISAALIAAALVASSVVTVMAGDGSGPFPK
jgi:hypothetical protein